MRIPTEAQCSIVYGDVLAQSRERPPCAALLWCCRYSKLRNGSNSSTQFPIVNPPSGWMWQGPWRVERGPNTDTNGWSYAVDFSLLCYPFHNGSSRRSMAHFVRRRRWVRQRCRDPSSTPAMHASSSRAHQAAPVPPSDCLVSLGALSPGGYMMIPLAVLEVSAELKVRPRNLQTHDGNGTGDGGPPCVHAWSLGASNGAHTLLLNIDALDQTTNRLLRCAKLSSPVEPVCKTLPAETADTATAPPQPQCNLADLQNGDVFLSLSIDTRRIDNAGPSETDWTITLSAPLALQNLLPVPAEYIMFELPSMSGSANVARQTGVVAAGKKVAVYATDVRTQVWHSYHAANRCYYGLICCFEHTMSRGDGSTLWWRHVHVHPAHLQCRSHGPTAAMIDMCR